MSSHLDTEEKKVEVIGQSNFDRWQGLERQHLFSVLENYMYKNPYKDFVINSINKFDDLLEWYF